MKLLLPALAASLMLMAFSCNQTDQASTSDSGATVQEVQLETPIVDEETKNEEEKKKEGKNEQVPVKNSNADWDKKIIKTGVINVQTEEHKNYSRQIHDLITKWEAYIAREEESESDGKVNNSLSIKVPVAHFDEAINNISSLKGKMLVKQISSQDVTGEMMDIRTRAEAKKRIRLRYLDMLQKAKNIEEVIQVEREINQIQEQIEAAEGRLNYLSHTTSYSTIELSFFQVLDPKAIEDPNPGYARRLLLALNEGLKWIGNVMIFFATLWPLWLIIAVGIVVIKRMRTSSVKAKD